MLLASGTYAFFGLVFTLLRASRICILGGFVQFGTIDFGAFHLLNILFDFKLLYEYLDLPLIFFKISTFNAILYAQSIFSLIEGFKPLKYCTTRYGSVSFKLFRC